MKLQDSDDLFPVDVLRCFQEEINIANKRISIIFRHFNSKNVIEIITWDYQKYLIFVHEIIRNLSAPSVSTKTFSKVLVVKEIC